MAVTLSLTKEQAALLVPVLLQLGVQDTNQQSPNQLSMADSPPTPLSTQRFKSPSSIHYHHTPSRSASRSTSYYSSTGNSGSEMDSSSEFTTTPMGKTCIYTVEEMLDKKGRNSKSSRAQSYLLVLEIVLFGVIWSGYLTAVFHSSTVYST